MGLYAKQQAFPGHFVDWEKILTEWASEDTNRVAQRKAHKFHQDVFKYLIRFSVAERLTSLGVKKWREEVLSDIDQLRWFVCYRKESTELIYSKLAHYEHMDQLREAAALLELTLWKVSIDHSMRDDHDEKVENCIKKTRMDACRIRSGAEIVVPYVFSFLLPV